MYTLPGGLYLYIYTWWFMLITFSSINADSFRIFILHRCDNFPLTGELEEGKI